ncbi:MAG: hypothetical protein WD058_09395 [Dehalococcoidia bacterium]
MTHIEGHESEYAAPALGADVATEDGKRLGSVGEVLGDYFRVDGDEGRQYWFGLALLSASDNGQVRTTFPESDLHTHAVPAPDRYQESQYNDGEPLSAEEKEQREVMLRQLSEQRRELHSDGAAMPEEDDTVGEPVEQELARMRGQDQGKPQQDAGPR